MIVPKLHNEVARREYFEEYAKSNNFDPLNAENWYQRNDEMLDIKVQTKNLYHYINHLTVFNN